MKTPRRLPFRIIAAAVASIVAITGVVSGAPPASATTPSGIDPLDPVKGHHAAAEPAPVIDPDAKSDPVPPVTVDIGETFEVEVSDLGEPEPEPSEPASSPEPTESATPR